MGNRNLLWQIDLTPMIGKRVFIETIEGHRRTGKLTEIRPSSVDLEGHRVDLPDEIVLDLDDVIPWRQLVKIGRVTPGE